MYCRPELWPPTEWIGKTWIDTSAAGVTVRVAKFDSMPPNFALIDVLPTATAVASPAVLMVALLESLDDQVDAVVTSSVVPFE
jgi:hypothetical protein